MSHTEKYNACSQHRTFLNHQTEPQLLFWSLVLLGIVFKTASMSRWLMQVQRRNLTCYIYCQRGEFFWKCYSENLPDVVWNILILEESVLLRRIAPEKNMFWHRKKPHNQDISWHSFSLFWVSNCVLSELVSCKIMSENLSGYISNLNSYWNAGTTRSLFFTQPNPTQIE